MAPPSTGNSALFYWSVHQADAAKPTEKERKKKQWMEWRGEEEEGAVVVVESFVAAADDVDDEKPRYFCGHRKGKGEKKRRGLVS